MARQLIWTKKAQNDRKQIFDYWNQRNQSTVYSLKLNQLFKNTVQLVLSHPKIGMKTKFNQVRFVTIKHY